MLQAGTKVQSSSKIMKVLFLKETSSLMSKRKNNHQCLIKTRDRGKHGDGKHGDVLFASLRKHGDVLFASLFGRKHGDVLFASLFGKARDGTDKGTHKGAKT